MLTRTSSHCLQCSKEINNQYLVQESISSVLLCWIDNDVIELRICDEEEGCVLSSCMNNVSTNQLTED